MDNRIEKLKDMQTSLLIDVVKNYKKYNYPLEFRVEALKILEQRGIKADTLSLSGNLNNTKYEEAIIEYKKYNLNSLIALIFHIISAILLKESGVISIIFYLVSPVVHYEMKKTRVVY
ncbi:hypothetical protein D1Z98_12310 [Riemerella anatipestifer]|uniref:hypothetical protein n=1 Tax=Riemerella anatipestifer TaxID=34085 RepID=UPI00129EC9FF|nr:hypothetical protein [Riemerella anatipestifer]MRM95673.1 hypothetical protein [Riemerella anatipestifer]